MTHPYGLDHPSIDELMERGPSRFDLVVLASKRARQINSYYNRLAEGALENVGPTILATDRDQPLTTALREIAVGNIELHTRTATDEAGSDVPDEGTTEQETSAVETEEGEGGPDGHPS